MTSLADVYVDVRGRTTGLAEDARKGGAKAGEEAGIGFREQFGSIIKGLAAGFAGLELFGFLKESVAAGREAAVALRLTEAGIKSTGGVAHVSAEDVHTLAERLGEVDGVQADIIQSGANLLLTFTNIRNEAGRGNDIFNQTTAAITDMTARMNGGVVSQEGLKASAIQVGKALQDPLKGLTSLHKVGVVFDDVQKKQIANFVKAGNVMGAQKIILAELNKEFGGSAAAATDPAQKGAVAWHNFKEQIGGYVMPVVALLVTLLTGKVMPAIRGVIDWVTEMAGWFKLGFIDGSTHMQGFAGNVQNFGNIVHIVFDWVRDNVLPILVDLVGWLQKAGAWLFSSGTLVSTLRAALGGAAVAILAIVVAIKIWEAAVKVYTTVQWLLNAALDANPIGLVIIAIAALAAGFYYLWTHSAGFRDFFIAMWHDIIVAAKAVANFFVHDIPAAWSYLWEHAVKVFHDIEAYINERWAVIMSYVQLVVRFFTVGIPAAWDNLVTQTRAKIEGVRAAIVNGFKAAVDWVEGVPGRIWSFFLGLDKKFGDIGVGIVTGIIHGIESKLGSLKDTVVNGAKDALNSAKSFLGISSPSKLFADEVGAQIPAGIAAGVAGNTKTAVNAVTGMSGQLPGVSVGGGNADVLAAILETNRLLAALRLVVGPTGLALAVRAGEKQLDYAGGSAR